MSRILITGSTGFVGSNLVPWLTARDHKIRVALRNPANLPAGIESAVIGDIADPRNLARALEDVSAVVHCAGVAHASAATPDAVYDSINRDATLVLARAAAKAGVKRFVLLSSIRAQSGPVAKGVLTEETPPLPTDAYGRSKLAAEQGLEEIDIDWVALRPVLVYGPGVKGNMRALATLARSGWPVPLGLVRAKRSVLAIENLNAAIKTVLHAPGSLRRPLIVADPEALSAGEMLAAMRKGLGRGSGLVPVPPALLATMAGLIGKSEVVARLTGALEASPAALIRLGWEPPVQTQAALARLARQM
jgi:nucleoside-diphosphate-sugar epimerase